jgi:hypothetical protein
MDERAFGIEVRRALLILLRAVEARYGLGSQEPRQPPASERREAALPRK